MIYNSCKHPEKYRFIDRDGELRCADCHKVISIGYQPSDDLDTSNPPQDQKEVKTAEEILSKVSREGIGTLRVMLKEEPDKFRFSITEVYKAMEEYKQINLVDFTDWLKWALFHNPDEDDSQTLVNEYLKHNS